MPDTYSIDSPSDGSNIFYAVSFTIEFTAPDRVATDYNVDVKLADTTAASYSKTGLVKVGPSPVLGHSIYRQTGSFTPLVVPPKTVKATVKIIFNANSQGDSISINAIKPPPAPGGGE